MHKSGCTRVSNPTPGILICHPTPRILEIEIPSMGSCSCSANDHGLVRAEMTLGASAACDHIPICVYIIYVYIAIRIPYRGMCVYAYIHMYICIYCDHIPRSPVGDSNRNIYIYTYVYMNIHTHIYIYMHGCIYISIYTYTYM